MAFDAVHTVGRGLGVGALEVMVALEDMRSDSIAEVDRGGV